MIHLAYPPTLSADNELEDGGDRIDDSHVIELGVMLLKTPCKCTLYLHASALYWSQIVKLIYPDQVDEPNLMRLIQKFIHGRQHPESSPHNIPDLPPSMKKLPSTHLLLPPSMLLATSLALVVWSTSTFMLLIVGEIALAVMTHCSSTLLLTMKTRMESHLCMDSLGLKLPKHAYFSHLP